MGRGIASPALIGQLRLEFRFPHEVLSILGPQCFIGRVGATQMPSAVWSLCVPLFFLILGGVPVCFSAQLGKHPFSRPPCSWGWP